MSAIRDPLADHLLTPAVEAHRAGLDRLTLAGGQPVSRVALACELQRDLARQETAGAVVQMVLTERLLKE